MFFIWRITSVIKRIHLIENSALKNTNNIYFVILFNYYKVLIIMFYTVNVMTYH